MEMPGYSQMQEQQRKMAEQQKKKETADREAKVAVKMRAAAAKMEQDKKDVIYDAVNVNSSFVRTFVRKTVLAFLVGSAAWAASKVESPSKDENGRPVGLNVMNLVYSPDLSFGDAVQNAYLFRDAFTEKGWLRGQGVLQGLAGFLSICIALNAASKERNYRKLLADEMYEYAEALKTFGLTERSVTGVQKKCGKWIISKMSEMDRGYVENLLRGGLNNANYEIVVAIVEGHLKSHPEDYQEIIQIIDEVTMPPELVKKYGKGKTISFGAAQVMAGVSKDR